MASVRAKTAGLPKRILVTGAAGFIGSNLVAELLRRGCEVVGYDNLSYGTEENFKGFSGSWEFVKGDVMDLEALQKATRGCDAVVHLAAHKIPRYSDAVDTLEVNAFGTKNVLMAAVANDCYVLAASTSDVYGKNPDIPFTESHASVLGDPTVKRWAYAVSKLFEEQLCFAYREKFGIPVTLVRFFGGYGPHQHLSWWGGPQSVFIDLALEGKPVEVHGDGQQTRSFTFVSDHVQGLVRCLESAQSEGHVFNLGNTHEITILDLAKLIWGLVRDDEPKVQLIPYETFGKYEDVQRRVPDISKARELLGYQPLVGLEDGLKTTIAWQRALRKSQQSEIAARA